MNVMMPQMTTTEPIEFPMARPLRITKHAKILSTGMFVPQNVVTNDDIIKRWDLIATDRAVKYSLGINERRWDDQNLAMSEMLVKATLDCLTKINFPADKLDRVIFARLFGDQNVPATALKVLKLLGCSKAIPAVDITAACSGFMHALDLGIKGINAGDDYTLILSGAMTKNLQNEFVNPEDQTIFLMGDAAVAVLLGPAEKEHFKCSYFYTNHTEFDIAYVPFGSATLNRSFKVCPELLSMKISNGYAIHQSVLASCKIIAGELMRVTHYGIDDLDFFITSDQTTLVWLDQLRELGIPQEKSASLFKKYGNTVAAMSPLILNELIESGRLKRGMKVMMMAHGAGSSAGGVVFIY